MNSIADILGYDTPSVQTTDDQPSSYAGSFPTDSTPVVEAKPVAEKKEDDTQKQIAQAKAMIHSMKDQLDALLRVLQGQESGFKPASGDAVVLDTGERVIEGVFNGQKMVGSDGSEYAVPPNYASKSKLVEGDMMKLTITKSGSFIYKQIGPIERKRIVGELVSGENKDQWQVLAEGRTYKILTASVTFYKGKAGDEVVLLVPEDGQSDWAAVENIIKK